MNNPVAFIRRRIFACQTQAEFAAMLGSSQASVSRWERDGAIPSKRQSVVRRAAIDRGLGWNDAWFFDVPNPKQDEGRAAA